MFSMTSGLAISLHTAARNIRLPVDTGLGLEKCLPIAEIARQ